MRGKEQLSLEEEFENRSIASVRIHVERAIGRVKNYRILKRSYPKLSALSIRPDLVYMFYFN